MIRGYQAEWVKLKQLPVWWMSLAAGPALAIFIFLIFLMNSGEVNQASDTPWIEYFKLSITIFGMLIVPFIILIVAGLLQPEHSGEMWKSLYALPLQRYQVIIPKLMMAISLVFILYLLFMVVLILSGYVLGGLAPVYGLVDAPLEIGFLFSRLLHLFIAGLGAIGLQFWLSLRFHQYLIPLSIGFVGNIISMFAVGKSMLAFWVPYCYPVFIVLGMGGSEMGSMQLTWMGPLVNVEWYSLLAIIVVTMVMVVEESGREIQN